MDPLHDLTLADVLPRAPAEPPDGRPRWCAATSGYTYPEFDERTNRLANALAAEGWGPGDRVLWLGQNCHRLLEGLLACAKIGAVFSPANWRQSAEELVTLLDDAAAKVVIYQEEEIGATVAEARGRWTGRGPLVAARPTDGEEPTRRFSASGTSAGPRGSWSTRPPVLQLYTGAFGGVPNGPSWPIRRSWPRTWMVAMVQRITEETVYLNSGPMFHVATLMTTFATFAWAGPTCSPGGWTPRSCRVIEAERCNYGFVMGPTAAEILEVNKDGRYDLSSLRTFGGGQRGTP